MRVLLDTNILIYREAAKMTRADIGVLFHWLDKLKVEKCIHPHSIDEINKHQDTEVRAAFGIKLKSYTVLKTEAPESDKISELRAEYDTTKQDEIDTDFLREVFGRRIDALITEDRGIHKKAAKLGIEDRIFTIDSFLEKANAENPDLADYKVLSVKKELFGNLDIRDVFFDSFRADYVEFDQWFNQKADETAYICRADDKSLVAFLYLKMEGEDENYGEIEPVFKPSKRLKIGTFKVTSNGYKLGERFLKIIFDNAQLNHVGEIYVTAFERTSEQARLIRLLGDWGFSRHGNKTTAAGVEVVLVRPFVPHFDQNDPRKCYPFVSRSNRKFIVPIKPKYHTELFPDSILRTESPFDFVENRPNRNAINKSYVSRSIERGLVCGDILIFYRTKADNLPARYTSVTTTLGIVQNVIANIKSEVEFLEICQKRTVFTEKQLKMGWRHKPNYRPFVVNFLYVHSFPKRMNLEQLQEAGVIDAPPRGFEVMPDEKFEWLLKGSNADLSLIVD